MRKSIKTMPKPASALIHINLSSPIIIRQAPICQKLHFVLIKLFQKQKVLLPGSPALE